MGCILKTVKNPNVGNFTYRILYKTQF